MTSDSHLAGTHEALFVVNKTSSPITFTHKGFNVDKKWYSKMAKVSLRGVSDEGEGSQEEAAAEFYECRRACHWVTESGIPNVCQSGDTYGVFSAVCV